MKLLMKYKITEIFYSIQGEGFWVGTPCIFIRLSGCNLSCSWCDTKHEIKKELNESEILEEIKQYPTKMVVITGGEPTQQLLIDLLMGLKMAGYKIHLETNGTIELSPAEEDSQTIFECGSTCILVDRPAGTPNQKISVKVFTESGKQLRELIDPVPAEPE